MRRQRQFSNSTEEREFLSYYYEYQDTNKPRYQITQVQRHAEAIAQQQARFGWRAYVSNAPNSRLCLTTAVFTYRDEWIAERGFHRLKGASLSIAPMFVQRSGPSHWFNPSAQFGPQVADPN